MSAGIGELSAGVGELSAGVGELSAGVVSCLVVAVHCLLGHRMERLQSPLPPILIEDIKEKKINWEDPAIFRSGTQFVNESGPVAFVELFQIILEILEIIGIFVRHEIVPL